MFSVHRFFLEIVDEMQKIVTSDRQRDYMLNWDPKTGLTFINVSVNRLRQSNTIWTSSLSSSKRHATISYKNRTPIISTAKERPRKVRTKAAKMKKMNQQLPRLAQVSKISLPPKSQKLRKKPTMILFLMTSKMCLPSISYSRLP